MIRVSCPTDLPQIMELLEEFCVESLSEYGMSMSPEIVKRTAENIYQTSLVIDNDGKIEGVIAGQLVTEPISGNKYFQEIVWYVRKENRSGGVRLFKALEKQAVLWGCSAIIMVHMANSKADKLAQFYQACGYNPMETHYIKQIGG